MIKSVGTVTLIKFGMPEVKVCDIVKGKPYVRRVDREEYIGLF